MVQQWSRIRDASMLSVWTSMVLIYLLQFSAVFFGLCQTTKRKTGIHTMYKRMCAAAADAAAVEWQWQCHRMNGMDIEKSVFHCSTYLSIHPETENVADILSWPHRRLTIIRRFYFDNPLSLNNSVRKTHNKNILFRIGSFRIYLDAICTIQLSY